MPWIKVSFDRFGYGRDAGPPPSFLVGWVRLSWWAGTYDALVMRLRDALKAAREELRS